MSSSHIGLAWHDNSIDEDQFHVERAPAGTTTFTEITTLAANVTGYQDLGLTDGTSYSYRVRASNKGGSSFYSNTTTATTLPSPPDSPNNLSATAASHSHVTVTWTDRATTENGFSIERCAGAGCLNFAEVRTTGSDVTAYHDSGLAASTSYSYRVRAYNRGGSSPYSNTATATTLASPPAAPRSLTVTAVSPTAVRLGWADGSNNEEGFRIERCMGNGCAGFAEIVSVPANITSYQDTGLAASTIYRYRLRAFNAGGYSQYSDTASAATLPPSVASLTVSPGGASLSGAGATRAYTAVARDAAGNVIPQSVDWTSHNQHVATVDASGVARAVSAGQVTICATAGQFTACGLLTVATPGVAAVDLWATMESGSTQRLVGVWGTSVSSVYAVGEGGTILHYNGIKWSPMSSGTSRVLSGVWGTSDSNVYAVGDVGTILRYDGAAWTAVASGTTRDLIRVWGTSVSSVYAAGEGGTLLHYDGIRWSAMSTGVSQVLAGIWGTSDSNVFAVGAAGTILRFDGISWQQMNSSTTRSLFGVWGTSESDVYAVGSDGVVVRYDGTGWTTEYVTVPAGPDRQLIAIWGTSSADVYAVGFIALDSSILHQSGSGWHWMADGSASPGFFGIWGTSSDVYAVAPFSGVIVRGVRNATISVTPSAVTLTSVGQQHQLLAVAHDDRNALLGGVDFSWSSSDSSVAAVSTNGIITAVGNGTAVVTASPGVPGLNASVTVTVSLTQPPNAPTNITATLISSTAIRLAWDAQSTNEEGFRIERCVGTACTDYRDFAGTAAGDYDYVNQGLAEGTTYRYRVRAFNSGGSARSLPRTIATPTRLTNSGGTIQPIAGATGSERMYVIHVPQGAALFSTQVDGPGGDADLYLRLGAPPTLQTFTLRCAAVGLDHCPIDNPASGDWYVMIHGFTSYSNWYFNYGYVFAGEAPPAAPTNLVASTRELAYTEVDLAWAHSGSALHGFVIELCQGAACSDFLASVTVPAATTAYTVTGLDPFATYRFQVRAFNGGGSSSSSNPWSATLGNVGNPTYHIEPLPTFRYGNWCGGGWSGGTEGGTATGTVGDGSPVDDLDAACKRHDLALIAADQYWRPRYAAAQTEAEKRGVCDSWYAAYDATDVLLRNQVDALPNLDTDVTPDTWRYDSRAFGPAPIFSISRVAASEMVWALGWTHLTTNPDCER